MYNNIRYLTFFLFLGAILTGCAKEPPSYLYNPDALVFLNHCVAHGMPDFWSGLGDGFTMMFAFVVRCLSNPNVRIYAFPNSGIGYEFGFIMGVVCSFPLWSVGIPLAILALLISLI
jgi:hypothetical protein